MSRDPVAKFEEWASKLQQSLQKNEIVNPSDCRYLIYWLRKIRGDTEREERARRILAETINSLDLRNQSLLEEALRHRRNSKVRLRVLWRYVYEFKQYIHPLAVENGDRRVIVRAVERFTPYVDEVVHGVDLLDAYQAYTMIGFLQIAEANDHPFNPEVTKILLEKGESLEVASPQANHLLIKSLNAESRGEYLAAFFLAFLSMRSAVETSAYVKWRLVKSPVDRMPAKKLSNSIDFLVECEEISPETAKVFKSAYLKYRSVNKLFRELGPVTDILTSEVNLYINKHYRVFDTEDWK